VQGQNLLVVHPGNICGVRWQIWPIEKKGMKGNEIFCNADVQLPLKKQRILL
jgi:hypothetical protein